jgi:phosphoglycerate dehydrogenase-like enzyme
VVPVEIPHAADKDFLLKAIPSAEIVITSWGTASFDEEVMAQAGELKLITHAAGSIKPILSDALVESGVSITSGAAAISYGVAEYCLGLMLLASKRAIWASNGTRRGFWGETVNVFGGPFELYRKNIGIIGMSRVGRHLARLL